MFIDTCHSRRTKRSTSSKESEEISSKREIKLYRFNPKILNIILILSIFILKSIATTNSFVDAQNFINRPIPLQTIVPIKAPPGYVVYKLQARPDSPTGHHNIRYALTLDRSNGRFEVDERSGDVRVRGSDPFLLDKEYVIYVRAEDHSRHGSFLDKTNRNNEVKLSIMGGRRAPQFYMERYSVSIREDTKKDSEILEIKAKSFSDREMRYTLQVKNKGPGTFIIDPITGKIKLAKDLDYENLSQPKSYILQVNASEDSGGFTSSTDVNIGITDVNDNAPRFELPDYQVYNILEDVKIGTKITTISATDLDSGKNAEIDYSIDRPEFSIDSKGNIITSRRLDADVNNTYVLTVKATDRGNPPLTGTAVVRIYTENTNDEAPKFSQDVYTPNVDENAGPRTLVTTVVASDKDGDNVIFGFAPGSKNPLFQIDERTGVIRLSNTTAKLDKDKYDLNVTARDDGKCCEGRGNSVLHTSTALVAVFITDVNDQKPTFDECANYNPAIREGLDHGTLVTTVKATDNDKGHNGHVRYSIVQQLNQKSSKFTIDESTGEIRTNKVFDREGEDGRFVSLTVKAVDRGVPPLEGVCSFKVEITDANDNPPLFDRQEYHERVRQDMSIGSHILRVSASDDDVDLNGAISYKLASSGKREDLDYFTISPETGWISLRKPLDRDSYRMRAIAQDQAPPHHNATVEVILDVVDRSNTPPQWDQPLYSRRIREDQPISSRIISIKASSGIKDNPNVFYTIIRGGTEQTNKLNTFYLTTRTDGQFTYADIFLNYNLDYERLTFYNLTVRAENDGNQQLASECSVNIEVEDVNDEIPLFVEREQQTVQESMEVGTKVTQVQAIDRDGTSPNNKVYYSIETPDGTSPYFTIDRETGEIFTSVQFDREEKQFYALNIRATDGAPSDRPGSDGRSPNSVTTKIRIGIGDKNDNSPYFDSPLYEAEVNEDEDHGHIVITVTAKDKDESSKLRYEIVKGNIGGGAFAVNYETGAIYVSGPLDYEMRKEYKLVLAASDSLNDNFTEVLIKVKDVNDNYPMFEKSTYQATITEGDDKKLPKSILKYNLTLVVSDSLNENHTNVLIHVKDVNDEPPVFTSNNYTTTIDEEMQGTHNILKVSAIDGDRDRPQNIVYFLTDQGTSDKDGRFFSINPNTGEIFVERPLDRDAPHGRPVWRFTVYAADEGGHNSQLGYADVVVTLRDINDNNPFFPNNVYIGEVSEGGVAGQTVMTMQAIDYDDPTQGNNAKLRYAIDQNQVNEQGELIFRIDEETGVINTAVPSLDRETNPEYTLKIMATDGGGHQGFATAIIKVKDINDMPPSFTKQDWFVEIDETLDSKIPELPILILQVTDGDTLESNRFSYKVLDGYGSDKFTMVTNTDGTGSLKVAKPLDFEDPEQRYGFNLTIQVNDGGEVEGVPHTDTTRVRVVLRDINDNPPEFERSSVEVTVREDAQKRTQLATFVAHDKDQGGTSKVRYAIDRSSDRRKQFAINPETGLVTTQRELDREEQPRMSVKILAIDDGVPQRTAVATLTVILEDVNDNPPKFLRDYVSIIYENSSPGKIEEIHAADLDDRNAGNGPPFKFSLDSSASPQIRDIFKVTSEMGTGDGVAHVYTNRVLDREHQKEYQVPIKITDGGHPSLSAVHNLTVIVGDINDNKMHPGSKTIFVYNYRGQYKNIPVGRVHVEDLDDWDLYDKKFMWENDIPHPNFHLDPLNGTIFMKNVSEGSYFLRFLVSDKKFTQDVSANVTIIVKNLPEEAVYNSGSIRLHHITDEDFIRVWDWKSQRQIKSKYELLKETLSKILKEPTENIDIFSVITNYRRGRIPETDVRFAAHGSPYHASTFLNGYVAINRLAIGQELQLNITMVGIDECLTEIHPCDGSCHNTLKIEPSPYVVNANRTSLVGVYTKVVPVCECSARSLDEIDGCNSQPPYCMNGGKCMMLGRVATCECPPGFNGPQCQITSRTFGGKGWSWFPHLEQCESSHLSVEFLTEQANGLILYNGPVDVPEIGVSIHEDMISLELNNGRPRLIVDFGSGTSEVIVNPPKELNDGEWHRVDIFWTREDIRMMIDHCTEAKYNETGDFPIADRSNCESKAMIKPFSEFLNLNSPLQVGGVFHREVDNYFAPHWRHKHIRDGFRGCIRNLIHNSRIYDLGSPGGSYDSRSGCDVSEEHCQSNSLVSQCEHGQCTGSMKSSKCSCDPGWTGPSCNIETSVKMFSQSSYMRYTLLFEPDPYHTEIQLRFRTRQKNGELIKIIGKDSREYCVLEIKEKRLRFRFRLDKSRSNREFELSLPEYIVSDGLWHTVKVSRYGSTASIEVDGGGGKKSNEITDYQDLHQMFMTKQSIVVGGEVNFIGNSQYYVENGLVDTCVTDIRINQRHLPMESGSENAAVTDHRNIIDGCVSTNSCTKANCPPQTVCTDLWNHYECSCPQGWIQTEDGICIDDNECESYPCLNGGTCINNDNGAGFYCNCAPGYAGDVCDLPAQEKMILVSNGAYGVIAFVLINVIGLEKKEINTNIRCGDRDECWYLSCGSGGVCHNLDFGGGYYCDCPVSPKEYRACTNCTCDNMLIGAPSYVQISSRALLVIITVCMLLSRTMDPKYGTNDPDDDVRENIISYDDEGGGEDDMHAFDITPLRIPIDPNGTLISARGKQNVFNKPGILKDLRKGTYGLDGVYNSGAIDGQFVDSGVRLIEGEERDGASRALDDLRNYAYEGCGSTAGSLSSLASVGQGDEIQNFDYLNRWGPRFQKLAYLYGQSDRNNPQPDQ